MLSKEAKILLVVLCVLTAISTFFITKSIYEVEIPPLPEPSTEVVKNEVVIPRVRLHAEIHEEPIVVPTDSAETVPGPAKDTAQPVIKVAEADSTILFVNKVQDTDSTVINAVDTLKIKVKYYFPPYNYFQLYPTLVYSNFKRTEYRPVYIEKEKEETFFDRFSFVVGAGYATEINRIEPRLQVFIGLAYRIKISY